MNSLNAHIDAELIPVTIGVDEDEVDITLEIEDYIGSGGSPPEYYEGEYVIIPKTDQQFLSTANKSMKSDLTVEQIPIHEFSNDSGTTIVIGGIL